jgi:hypothetical protein
VSLMEKRMQGMGEVAKSRAEELMGLTAKDLPVGTVIEIPAQRLKLRREHGKKPWRQFPGRSRFTHAEVDGSIAAGEVTVVAVGDGAVAAV